LLQKWQRLAASHELSKTNYLSLILSSQFILRRKSAFMLLSYLSLIGCFEPYFQHQHSANGRTQPYMGFLRKPVSLKASRILQVGHLLSLHLNLQLLLLLLLLLVNEMSVHLGGARHADDGRAEVTDRVLRHRRQRRRLLAPLRLRPTVEVQRHPVYARVEHDHRRQRDPEIADLHTLHTRLPHTLLPKTVPVKIS